MNTGTTPKPPRTKRRWLRRALALVVLVAGAVAGLVVYDRWQQWRAWDEACAEADRLDPGWRWEDMVAARPDIPAERNSFLRAQTSAKGLANWLQRPIKHGEYQDLLPQHRPSPTLVAALRELVDSAGPAGAESLTLADYPEGQVAWPASPVILTPNERRDEIVWLTEGLLSFQVVLQVEEGNLDTALATVRAILFTAHPLADSPRLYDGYFAGLFRLFVANGVERVLAQGEPSGAALEALRRLMEQDARRSPLLASFRGRRAFLEDTVCALDDGRLHYSDVEADGTMRLLDSKWTGWPTADYWLNRLFRNNYRPAILATHLRYLTWAIERLKESPDGIRAHAAEGIALRDQLPADVRRHATAYGNFVSGWEIDEGRFRSAIAALAAEQFRQAHGRWPNSLDELVPQYLSVVPRDPIDLRPLRLAKRPDGIVIYSVGNDGQDDGGDLALSALASGLKKGRDMGVRLWDVSHRRQPPVTPIAERGTKK